jgi:hypothetical protein
LPVSTGIGEIGNASFPDHVVVACIFDVNFPQPLRKQDYAGIAVVSSGTKCRPPHFHMERGESAWRTLLPSGVRRPRLVLPVRTCCDGSPRERNGVEHGIQAEDAVFPLRRKGPNGMGRRAPERPLCSMRIIRRGCRLESSPGLPTYAVRISSCR